MSLNQFNVTSIEITRTYESNAPSRSRCSFALGAFTREKLGALVLLADGEALACIDA